MSETKANTPMDRMLDKVEWVEVKRSQTPPDDGIPYATHSGVLDIYGHTFKVYRLSDGQRIIDAEDFARFMVGLCGISDGQRIIDAEDFARFMVGLCGINADMMTRGFIPDGQHFRCPRCGGKRFGTTCHWENGTLVCDGYRCVNAAYGGARRSILEEMRSGKYDGECGWTGSASECAVLERG